MEGRGEGRDCFSASFIHGAAPVSSPREEGRKGDRRQGREGGVGG